MKQLVDGISTCDVDATLGSITKVKMVFEQCERMLNLEKRQRQYRQELNDRIEEKERKETVKRLTMQMNFNRKATKIEVPSPPSSQEMLDV